jgi:hypothetical protein
MLQFLSGYEPSVVAEVAGPFVAQSLDAWELMLLRVSTSEDEPSRSAALLSEMSVLLGKARSSISDLLTPYSEHTELSSKVRKIEVRVPVHNSPLKNAFFKFVYHRVLPILSQLHHYNYDIFSVPLLVNVSLYVGL